MAQAIEVANRIAPEHLELSVENPEQYLPQIRHAGAIFMGPLHRRSLGDYCAGPGTTCCRPPAPRFSSPLGCMTSRSARRSSIARRRCVGAGQGRPVLARRIVDRPRP